MKNNKNGCIDIIVMIVVAVSIGVASMWVHRGEDLSVELDDGTSGGGFGTTR